MCGRSSITLQEAQLEKAFNASFYQDDVVKYHPSFNITPTHFIPIITSHDPKVIRMAHWGFQREWKDFKTGKITNKLLFNAKGETVHELRSFKEQFANNQRCAILFDGFYEWMQTEIGKIPFRISLKNSHPFAIAGIWEEKELEGVTTLCANVITTKPNEMLKLVHNKPGKERMPAILSPEHQSQWLDNSLSTPAAKELICTYPVEEMLCHPVTNELNGSYINDPKFIEVVHYDFNELDKLLAASEKFGFVVSQDAT